MKMKKSLLLIITILFTFTTLLAGCAYTGVKEGASAPTTPAAKGPIVVASKIDTEGSLLGKMIILMLQANNFKVVDKTQLGTTDVIRKAIINNEIDIYPEYTGNGGFFFKNTQPAIWKDAQKGYATVKNLDKTNNNIIWLNPAKANNTWAIAINKSFAAKNKITSLADLATYVNKGGEVKLAGSEEFISRSDALPAFQTAYGFKFKKNQLLTLSGGNTAQTEKAAAEGTDGVNLAMAYGTDGSLAALGLSVLEDSKGVQPVYEPAPIIRNAIISKYPEIATILKPVFEQLDLITLQSLNSKIAVEGRDATSVAKEFLTSKGLVK